MTTLCAVNSSSVNVICAHNTDRSDSYLWMQVAIQPTQLTNPWSLGHRSSHYALISKLAILGILAFLRIDLPQNLFSMSFAFE